MNVIIFGATGMVGRGVLIECLRDPGVDRVLCVGRSPAPDRHAKLRSTVVPDPGDLSTVAGDLAGYDACFFCLGVSAGGMSEEKYRRLTYDLTLGAARTLAELNPGMTFIYVSGTGTDSTEHGRVMWARVKGATENALLRLPFKAAYMFRPGAIQPLHGITSRTRLYRVIYAVTGPLWPILRRLFPNQISTTARIGMAMLAAAQNGAPKSILEPPDIEALARTHERVARQRGE
jgi:uncharacterized protein YbjT (DUF2867 family)